MQIPKDALTCRAWSISNARIVHTSPHGESDTISSYAKLHQAVRRNEVY